MLYLESSQADFRNQGLFWPALDFAKHKRVGELIVSKRSLFRRIPRRLDGLRCFGPWPTRGVRLTVGCPCIGGMLSVDLCRAGCMVQESGMGHGARRRLRGPVSVVVHGHALAGVSQNDVQVCNEGKKGSSTERFL